MLMRRWILRGEVRIPLGGCLTMVNLRLGKLRLEPTVVGMSKFNESVQKLKNGQVAG